MKFKTDEMLDTVVDNDPIGLNYKKRILETVFMISRSKDEKGLKAIVDMQFRHAQKALEEYLLYLRKNISPNFAGEPEDKVVNSPSHYTAAKIEVIDVITDLGLSFNFCISNAIKYLMRAGLKDESKLVEDVKKAKWYIERAEKEYNGAFK